MGFYKMYLRLQIWRHFGYPAVSFQGCSHFSQRFWEFREFPSIPTAPLNPRKSRLGCVTKDVSSISNVVVTVARVEKTRPATKKSKKPWGDLRGKIPSLAWGDIIMYPCKDNFELYLLSQFPEISRYGVCECFHAVGMNMKLQDKIFLQQTFIF